MVKGRRTKKRKRKKRRRNKVRAELLTLQEAVCQHGDTKLPQSLQPYDLLRLFPIPEFPLYTLLALIVVWNRTAPCNSLAPTWSRFDFDTKFRISFTFVLFYKVAIFKFPFITS